MLRLLRQVDHRGVRGILVHRGNAVLRAAMISPLPALSRNRNLPLASLYSSNLPAMLFSLSVTRRLVLDRCRLVSRLWRPCTGVEQAVEEHGSAPINWDRGCGPAAEVCGRCCDR